MIVAEVAERKTVEVMFVRGVAERTVIGVMRSFNANPPARPHQAMELFHRPDNVGQMFDNVDSSEAIKGSVGEGIRKAVQIADHVGGARRVQIDTDRAWILADAATDVEDSWPILRKRPQLEMPADAGEPANDRATRVAGNILR